MEAQAANTAESFWKLVEQFRCAPWGGSKPFRNSKTALWPHLRLQQQDKPERCLQVCCLSRSTRTPAALRTERGLRLLPLQICSMRTCTIAMRCSGCRLNSFPSLPAACRMSQPIVG